MKRTMLAAVSAAMLGTGANAAELTFGIGGIQYHFGGPEAAHLQLEVTSAPFARLGPNDFSWAGAVSVNDTGSWYVGAGVSAEAEFARDWFVESSLMAGRYDAGESDAALGGPLELRIASAIGRRLAGGSKVSLGWVHLSNAGTGDFNPGADALVLRFTRPF